MLFLHEVHRMVGTREAEFEAAFREGWMPMLSTDEDARLLWYLNAAHGSGPSYQAVTITAVADGAAWERLARRVQQGDLRDWAREVDTLRHDVESRLLMPLDFSPLDLDLATVPVDGTTHEPSLYMEDTMWPKVGRVDAYLDAVGTVYAGLLASDQSHSSLRIVAAYQTFPGAGRYPEVTLMQKVQDMDRLVELITTDPPAEVTAPGSWMDEALDNRDEWTSSLLRSATWSPLD